MHSIVKNQGKKLSLNNLTLFDTEYKSDAKNIFFIRSSVGYRLNQHWMLNAFFGVKNPGSFWGSSIQYGYLSPQLVFGYSIGPTFQRGFTLEQSLRLEYYPTIAGELQAHITTLAIANINTEEYQRGVYHFKLGLRSPTLAYGLALNMDHFNNATRKLENAGFFIKTYFR